MCGHFKVCMAHLSKFTFYFCWAWVGRIKNFKFLVPKNKFAAQKTQRCLNNPLCLMLQHKNSKLMLLNDFFPCQMLRHKKLALFELCFFLPNVKAWKTHAFWIFFLFWKRLQYNWFHPIFYLFLFKKFTFNEPFFTIFWPLLCHPKNRSEKHLFFKLFAMLWHKNTYVLSTIHWIVLFH